MAGLWLPHAATGPESRTCQSCWLLSLSATYAANRVCAGFAVFFRAGSPVQAGGLRTASGPSSSLYRLKQRKQITTTEFLKQFLERELTGKDLSRMFERFVYGKPAGEFFSFEAMAAKQMATAMAIRELEGQGEPLAHRTGSSLRRSCRRYVRMLQCSWQKRFSPTRSLGVPRGRLRPALCPLPISEEEYNAGRPLLQLSAATLVSSSAAAISWRNHSGAMS